MRSSSAVIFKKKSGFSGRRLAPGPGLNRLKSKNSTCVPLKTLKLKVLWEVGTKLISIAKLHLEVLRAVKPKNLSPAQKRPRLAGSPLTPLNETSWLRPWESSTKIKQYPFCIESIKPHFKLSFHTTEY